MPPKENRRCNSYRSELFRFAAENQDVTHLMLVARWPLYVEGEPLPSEGAVHFSMNPRGPGEDEGSYRNIRNALHGVQTRMQQAGKTVVLVGTAPEIPWDVLDGVKASILFGRSLPPDPTAEQVLARQARSDAVLKAVATASNTYFIPIASELCRPTCPTHDDASVYYRDNNHLTPAGARLLLTPILEKALAEVPRAVAAGTEE